MIGAELAGNSAFLLRRATGQLDLTANPNSLALRLAPLYIGLFGIPEIGLHLRMRRILSCLPAEVGRVVDIGSGAGMLLGEIKRSRRFVELVAIEKDPESAAVSQAAHPYARIVCEDIDVAIRSLGGRFDFAVVADVLQFVSDDRIVPFLRACSAMLKPGGHVIIHVPTVPQRRIFARFRDWTQPDQQRDGFTQAMLAKALENAGLRPVRMAPTVGAIAALAWELNMLIAGSATQAALFPPLLLLACLGELLPSRWHNTVLCVSQRP